MAQGAATVGTGNVVGPASSTDLALARFDATTGKLLQNSSVTLGDNVAGALAEVLLATVTAIDMTAVADTNLYAASGADYIVTRVVLKPTVANTVTVVPTVGIGTNVTEDDWAAAGALTGLDTVGECWQWSPTGLLKVVLDTETLKLGVDVGATAVAMTATVYVFGFRL